MRYLIGLTIALTVGTSTLRSDELPRADPREVGLAGDELSKVVPTLRAFVDQKRIAGAVVAVARDGKIALLESVGWQQIDSQVPMSTDTIFRIYSMSKPITTVAAMTLVEDGKISLDEAVGSYLPELAESTVFIERRDGKPVTKAAQRAMTVRDLMRHTSGLTYGLFGDTDVDQQYVAAKVLAPEDTLAELTTKLGQLPLICEPGTRFCYSVSTDVLGRIVEVVSGQPLDEFLQERIFEPLEMNDTGFYVPADKIERFAANYSPTPEGGLRLLEPPTESPFLQPPTLLSGGGGLVSTARDYLRFCQMLLGGGELYGQRILDPTSVAEMFRNQLPEQAYPIELGRRRDGVAFGLGFHVIRELTEYTSLARIGEVGWGGAASTHFWISKEDDLAVVVLSQLMPYSDQLEAAVKPLVYESILEPSPSP